MHPITRLFFDLSDRRWRFHLAAVVVVAPTLIFAVLLHGGSGGFWDLAVGQFRVGPTIERADVSLRPPADEPTRPVEVDLASEALVERVPPEYLSLAIDATPFDGELPALAQRMRAFAGTVTVPPLSATFATLPGALVEGAQ